LEIWLTEQQEFKPEHLGLGFAVCALFSKCVVLVLKILKIPQRVWWQFKRRIVDVGWQWSVALLTSGVTKYTERRPGL
jgi:hypothetical protein